MRLGVSGAQRRAGSAARSLVQLQAAAQRSAAMWVCGSETFWRLPSDGERKSIGLSVCEWVWRKTRRNVKSAKFSKLPR